jgi:hypothetical protein
MWRSRNETVRRLVRLSKYLDPSAITIHDGSWILRAAYTGPRLLTRFIVFETADEPSVLASTSDACVLPHGDTQPARLVEAQNGCEKNVEDQAYDTKAK